MARQFSAKVRRYMMGYYHQMKERVLFQASGDIIDVDEKPSFVKNEQLYKQYKSHRETNTMEGPFIERVMRECIGLGDLEE